MKESLWRRISKYSSLMLLALTLLTSTVGAGEAKILSLSAEENVWTKVYVDPPSIVDPTLVLGESFSISVQIFNVTNLWGVDIWFSWDPALLEYVDHTTTIPVDDYPGGVLYEPILPIADKVDAAAGTYHIAKASMLPEEGTTPSFNGSGTVFNMTFEVKATGSCVLDITSSDLAGKYPPGPLIILHTVEDGYFSNMEEVHDIAITDVTPSRTTVTMNESVSISVTVENQGTATETFDVSAYYDSELIEIQEDVSLDAEDTATLHFTWDTTGVPKGTYTITAEVSLLPDEEETADNTFIGGEVTIILPGITIHDVAITELVLHPTEIYAGWTVSISVTMENVGQFLENVNLTVYCDDNPIVTQENVIIFPSGVACIPGDLILNFVWDTTGLSIGNHTIRAEASVVPDEVEAENNVLVTDVVKVHDLGDINGDDKVDVYDVVMASSIFHSALGDPNWNPLIDLAPRWGFIDVYDLCTILYHWTEPL